MKNLKQVITFKQIMILLFLFTILPYPTKPFCPFQFSLTDELGRPLSNINCTYRFFKFPSLKDKEINMLLDNNGNLSVKAKYVWMNWLLRRGYDILTISAHDGWSTTESYLTIKIPHKNFGYNKVRIAKLDFPKITGTGPSTSFNPNLPIDTIAYVNAKGVPLFDLITEIHPDGDIIKLNILKSRDQAIAKIKVSLIVLSPKIRPET